MALGTLSEYPDIGLKIVPAGMNYFHAHKFRSRAVVEFGTPFEVPKELVDMFRNGERREATARLLKLIYESLVAVTLTSPDYDTLMVLLLDVFDLSALTFTVDSSSETAIQSKGKEIAFTKDH